MIQKNNKSKIFIGILIIVIVILGGYLGYRQYKQHIQNVKTESYQRGIFDLSVELNKQGVFPIVNLDTGQIEVVSLQQICGGEE